MRCVRSKLGVVIHGEHHRQNRCAFSLVELVIVIVIIGIIAAIAVPRFASASHSAKVAQAKASCKVMQDALDMFMAEHATFDPTSCGLQPDECLAVRLQSAQNHPGMLGDMNILERASNAEGDTITDPGDAIYGPYLRKMPTNTLIHPTQAADTGGLIAGPHAYSNAFGWCAEWEPADPQIGYYDAPGGDCEMNWH